MPPKRAARSRARAQFPRSRALSERLKDIRGLAHDLRQELCRPASNPLMNAALAAAIELKAEAVLRVLSHKP
jgi:hypothetical protein